MRASRAALPDLTAGRWLDPTSGLRRMQTLRSTMLCSSLNLHCLTK